MVTIKEKVDKIIAENGNNFPSSQLPNDTTKGRWMRAILENQDMPAEHRFALLEDNYELTTDRIPTFIRNQALIEFMAFWIDQEGDRPATKDYWGELKPIDHYFVSELLRKNAATQQEIQELRDLLSDENLKNVKGYARQRLSEWQRDAIRKSLDGRTGNLRVAVQQKMLNPDQHINITPQALGREDLTKYNATALGKLLASNTNVIPKAISKINTNNLTEWHYKLFQEINPEFLRKHLNIYELDILKMEKLDHYSPRDIAAMFSNKNRKMTMEELTYVITQTPQNERLGALYTFNSWRVMPEGEEQLNVTVKLGDQVFNV